MHCAGVRMPFDEAQKIVRAGGMPKCPKCGRVLKPAITFFGEALPMKALSEAEDESRQADLMLVLGTSLTVMPAASLPENTLSNGGEVVIVNNQPTSLDNYAVMRFEDLADTFTQLAAMLGK
jgi:NAD-dependent deacetylase